MDTATKTDAQKIEVKVDAVADTTDATKHDVKDVKRQMEAFSDDREILTKTQATQTEIKSLITLSNEHHDKMELNLKFEINEAKREIMDEMHKILDNKKTIQISKPSWLSRLNPFRRA